MKTLASHMFWPSLIIYEISLPRVLFWILPHVDPLSVSPNSYWLCLPPHVLSAHFLQMLEHKDPYFISLQMWTWWCVFLSCSKHQNAQELSATFAFNWILGMPGQTFISGEWQPCSTCFCGHRLSSSWCPTFIICPPLHHLLLFTACYCAFLFNQIFRAVGPYSWMLDLLSFPSTAPQGREPRSPEHLLRWAPCKENLLTESKSFLSLFRDQELCLLPGLLLNSLPNASIFNESQ